MYILYLSRLSCSGTCSCWILYLLAEYFAFRDVARLEEKLNDVAAVVTASPRPLLNASADGGTTSIIRQSIFADISDKEAQGILHKFQTEMLPYFPFVAVPPDATASELRQSKPFLFCTMVTVSCLDDTERQLDMAHSIRECIGSAIVTRGEKGLDLLQGLLVCLGWYHLQLELGSQIRSVLHLSLAMLSDLGLNRRPSLMRRILPLESFPADYERKTTHRTLDERRTYLGCFYMSAMYVSALIRPNLRRANIVEFQHATVTSIR